MGRWFYADISAPYPARSTNWLPALKDEYWPGLWRGKAFGRAHALPSARIALLLPALGRPLRLGQVTRGGMDFWPSARPPGAFDC